MVSLSWSGGTTLHCGRRPGRSGRGGGCWLLSGRLRGRLPCRCQVVSCRGFAGLDHGLDLEADEVISAAAPGFQQLWIVGFHELEAGVQLAVVDYPAVQVP